MVILRTNVLMNSVIIFKIISMVNYTFYLMNILLISYGGFSDLMDGKDFFGESSVEKLGNRYEEIG